MNYYRITFNRITIPDPQNQPLNRHWDWYDLTCQAKNRTEARNYGLRVADAMNVTFVDAMKLLKVVGAAQSGRKPAFQKLT